MDIFHDWKISDRIIGLSDSLVNNIIVLCKKQPCCFFHRRNNALIMRYDHAHAQTYRTAMRQPHSDYAMRLRPKLAGGCSVRVRTQLTRKSKENEKTYIGNSISNHPILIYHPIFWVFWFYLALTRLFIDRKPIYSQTSRPFKFSVGAIAIYIFAQDRLQRPFFILCYSYTQK